MKCCEFCAYVDIRSSLFHYTSPYSECSYNFIWLYHQFWTVLTFSSNLQFSSSQFLCVVSPDICHIKLMATGIARYNLHDWPHSKDIMGWLYNAAMTQKSCLLPLNPSIELSLGSMLKWTWGSNKISSHGSSLFPLSIYLLNMK